MAGGSWSNCRGSNGTQRDVRLRIEMDTLKLRADHRSRYLTRCSHNRRSEDSRRQGTRTLLRHRRGATSGSKLSSIGWSEGTPRLKQRLSRSGGFLRIQLAASSDRSNVCYSKEAFRPYSSLS